VCARWDLNPKEYPIGSRRAGANIEKSTFTAFPKFVRLPCFMKIVGKMWANCCYMQGIQEQHE
jgi:hypothetical protein